MGEGSTSTPNLGVDTAKLAASLARVAVFGGQGTINVNSWSLDSGRFAFVSYPSR
jgi:hypothetical protein